jgi:O-antigen ligase
MKLLSVPKKTSEIIFVISAALVVCTLPFSVRLNAISIVVFSIFYLLEGDLHTKYQRLFKNKFALLFIGLYLLHVIGLLYTSNLKQGFFELEKKIAFVVFPLIFATSTYVNGRLVAKLLFCFVSVCFVGAIISVVNGLYHFLQGDASYLFYHKLGSAINFDHAIYFSFYIAFSIFILLIFLRNEWKVLPSSRKISLIAVVVFFVVFLILLSSKTIIVTVFVLLIFVKVRIRFRKKEIVLGSLTLLISIAVLASVVLTVPNIRNRFQDAFIADREQGNPLLLDDYYGFHFTPGNIRLAVWKLTFEVINENDSWIAGVGTGDSQDLLTAKYIEKHVYPGDPTLGTYGFLHYNAHNQFLQFLLMFGVIGLVCFVAILSTLLRKSVINGEASILFFLFMLFTAFCLTESVLHVQKGIVFFLFFSSLLSRESDNNDPLLRG